MQHLILGTAGHIDHGKSSLVKCLTGSDPDRLPEEKSRGVTIELGFAHLSLSGGGQNYELGIIDVPGHADFVNNMVAGVGALDIALFIIAADDGWMPQSEEHLHILTYLGISNTIIALTKTDLCDDVAFSMEMLREELLDTPIANAPIIPVSSITGDGIGRLKTALLENLQNCPPHKNTAKPRLSIDRIFSPKGTGTVVTGTLTGGNIHLGDSLLLQPMGLTTKVRYIQNHNQSIDTALPGMRTALNLPDLPVDAPGKPGVQRGDILTTAICGKPTDTLDIHLERLARPIPGIKPRSLKHMETVIVHHGSARRRARVILHDRNQLKPGENCLAQLRLEKPLFLLTGDRLVLRDGSQQSTIAGGTVLDARAARKGFRSEDRATFLQARVNHLDDARTCIRSLLARDHEIDGKNPLPNNPFHPDEISKAIEDLVTEGSAVKCDTLLLHAKWWKQQTEQAAKIIKTWHRDHPDLPSMPLENLAKATPLAASTFQQLTKALAGNGYQLTGKGISHPTHTLTLPDQIKDIAAAITAQLDQTCLNPPNKAGLTSSAEADQAMKFLIRSGQVIELDPKVVISAASRDAAIEGVQAYINSHGQATASELRQHLDTTRKILMPLLEHLDSIGVTVRNGNYRTLAARRGHSP